MKLIIVESPTKAKTIQQFLGKEYHVQSSFGHVRDLPKSRLGVDVEKNFEPQYVIPTKARKTVTALKKGAEKASEVILGTDEDREGEAIAWHLASILSLKKPRRIAFHEITQEAIEHALRSPRALDINLVDSQQARRILDRLVGYKLSPFLWRKVLRGLSAGRVQSSALRIVVDREREIEKFIPQEYWDVEAVLGKITDNSQQLTERDAFTAQLVKKDKKSIEKLGIKSKDEAEEILRGLKGASYAVERVEKKETQRNPLPPFTTSTLQQEASRKLGFSAKQTMMIAQQLYETGLITYHRTDSMNLSTQALQDASRVIVDTYGKEYAQTRRFKTSSKGAQEAHEAVRPTRASAFPERMGTLQERSLKLYRLVWQRFIASQMTPGRIAATTVDVLSKGSDAATYTFRANGQTLLFDGFLKVYPMKFEEMTLPMLQKGEALSLKELKTDQHFTQPPARYTEAGLVKALEEYGIGRPSTYAPTISTIQLRGYVEKNKERRFVPTDLGKKVTDLLSEHFPQIVDIGFTASVEEKFDDIAEGKTAWIPMIREFYEPFAKLLATKEIEIVKEQAAPEEVLGKTCPKCSSPIVIRVGRFGRFYACSAFPKCKHTEPIENKNTDTGVVCPLCKKGALVSKRTKKGKIFYACNQYPACDFALWDKPTGEQCARCGSLMVQKAKGAPRCSGKTCAKGA